MDYILEATMVSNNYSACAIYISSFQKKENSRWREKQQIILIFFGILKFFVQVPLYQKPLEVH